MRFSHHPPAQSLAEWLDVATRDLVPSAQARIRAEIEAHYHEAVQTQLANGAPESDAQIATLADLGSAKWANRRLRREHLTIKNARNAARIGKGDRSGWDVITMINLFFLTNLRVIPLLLDGHDFDFPAQRQLYTFGSLGLYVLLFSVCITAYLLRKKETTIANRRQTLLFKCIVLLLLGILFLLEGSTLPSLHNYFTPKDQFIKPYFPFIMAGMSVICIYSSYRLFRLRTKLRDADENDIPPPDARAAWWPISSWKR